VLSLIAEVNGENTLVEEKWGKEFHGLDLPLCKNYWKKMMGKRSGGGEMGKGIPWSGPSSVQELLEEGDEEEE
jgi:hypothetical protein